MAWIKCDAMEESLQTVGKRDRSFNFSDYY